MSGDSSRNDDIKKKMLYDLRGYAPITQYDQGKEENNSASMKEITIISIEDLNNQNSSKILIVDPKIFHEIWSYFESNKALNNEISSMQSEYSTFIDNGKSILCQNRLFKEFADIKFFNKGAFGSICKAKHHISEHYYAIKKIKIKRKDFKSLSNYEEIRQEVVHLSNLNHGNIVRYHTAWIEEHDINEDVDSTPNSSEESTNYRPNLDSSDKDSQSLISNSNLISFSLSTQASKVAVPDQDNMSKMENQALVPYAGSPTKQLFVYIQMELCSKNLRDWITEKTENCQKFPVKHRSSTISLIRQLLHGIKFIHEAGIIHRDIKPENIFLTHDNEQLKIGDFGLATLIPDPNQGDIKLSFDVGTSVYMAPEVSQKSRPKYDEKIDIYSAGVVILEILLEFKTRSELVNGLRDILDDPRNMNGDIPKRLNAEWGREIEILLQMLSQNPSNRPSAADLCANNQFLRKKQDEISELKQKIIELTTENRKLRELLADSKIEISF